LKPYIGVWCHTSGAGTWSWDNISLTKGDQYTSYVDTTTAKDRCLPDMFFKIATSEYTPSVGSTICTLPVTIDYNARLLIWTGANIKFNNVSRGTSDFSEVNLRLIRDGTTIGSCTMIVNGGGVTDIYQEVSDFNDTTVSAGVHTISLYGSGWHSGGSDIFTVYKRYIRIIAGSYFEI